MMPRSCPVWCTGLVGIRQWHLIALRGVAGTSRRQGITPLPLLLKTSEECWIPCGISTPIPKQLECERVSTTPIPTMGITAGWKLMSSVSGTPASCNWHQPWRDAPSVMSVSASGIATTPRERVSVTGAQGCSNDWWQLEVLTEARESVFHQGNSNCFLYLIVASIKSQRNGIKWRWDLDELMAFVMAI